MNLAHHIEATVGPIESVRAGPMGISLIVTSPTAANPCRTLLTAGMSSRVMRSPSPELSRAELFVQLPPQWPVEGTEFAKPEWFWPFRTLFSLASYVVQTETWLGAFHTIPNGGPFDPSTRLSGCILLPPPPSLPANFSPLSFENQQLNFLCVCPLHQAEIDLAIASGPADLLDRLAAADCSSLLDPLRESVC